MKKIWKRIMSLFLVVFMLFGTAPIGSVAATFQSNAQNDNNIIDLIQTDSASETDQKLYYSTLLQFRTKWDKDSSYVYHGHAFHDIDEDGQNELIIHDGTCEQDRTYYFYTVKQGTIISLGTRNAWHSGLADGDKKLIAYAGMGGQGSYSYITISGNTIIQDQVGSYTFPPTPNFGKEIQFTEIWLQNDIYLYEPVFSQYSDLIQNDYYHNQDNWYEQIGLYVNQYIAQYRSPVFYSLFDIDSNGIQELIISDTDSFEHILDIFTYAGGKIYELQHDISGWYSSQGGDSWGDRAQVYIIDNGNIAIRGSGGASIGGLSIYQYGSDGFTVSIVDDFTYTSNGSGFLYYRGEEKPKNQISESEFNRFVQQYTKQSFQDLKSNVMLVWHKFEIKINPSVSVFNEEPYIADIWLNQNGKLNTPEANYVDMLMGFDSISGTMYYALQDDARFRAALLGWNGLKVAFDSVAYADQVLSEVNIYESLILDLLEKVAKENNEALNHVIIDAVDTAGEVGDQVTKYKKYVDNLVDLVDKPDKGLLELLKEWKFDPNCSSFQTFYGSLNDIKDETGKWTDSKVVKGIGTIAEVASDISDFYAKFVGYLYVVDMAEEMQTLLKEMQAYASGDLYLALTKVISAVGNADYLAAILGLDFGKDILVDVSKEIFDEITKLCPGYYTLRMAYKAAVAFDNLLFNTSKTIDKYYLIQATTKFIETDKKVIQSLGRRYVSEKTTKNAGAYIYAVKAYHHAYIIDMESSAAFIKAGDDEGIVNGIKKHFMYAGNLITGETNQTSYQQFMDSKDSIERSLKSSFWWLDNSWKFSENYLKTDYPTVFPIYLTKELSSDLYSLYVDAHIATSGSTEINWDMPWSFYDKDGELQILYASSLVDGISATEDVGGEQKTLSYSPDSLSDIPNPLIFNNVSKFKHFPKNYSVVSFSTSAVNPVYTTPVKQTVQNPLKPVVISVPQNQIANGNWAKTGISLWIVDASNSMYENITYDIYRKADGSSWTKIGSATRQSTSVFDFLHKYVTSFHDASATGNHSYSYKIVSHYRFGNGVTLDSPESNVFAVTKAANTSSLPVSMQKIVGSVSKKSLNEVKAQAATDDMNSSYGYQLTWEKTDGAVQYEVYRKSSYGSIYKMLATVSNAKYTDYDVEDGIEYNYAIIPVFMKEGTATYSTRQIFEGTTDNVFYGGQCGDSVYWRYVESTGTIIISGTGPMYDYESFSFDGDEEYAPWRKDDFSGTISSVIIESGVTGIGDNTFYDLKDIASVSLPSTLTEIGGWAFSGCESITSIELPTSLKALGRQAFSECGISEINLPKNLEDIGGWCFEDCSNLTSIKVDANNPYYSSENGVLYNKNKTVLVRYPIGKTATKYTVNSNTLEIGDSAFENAINLKEIVLPYGIQTLGWCAFYDCNNLRKMDLPETITQLKYSSLRACDFENVTIPQSITSIESCLLEDNENLQYVGLPDGITIIDSFAFDGCKSLTSIYIPSNVTKIGYSAFGDCSGLHKVCYNGTPAKRANIEIGTYNESLQNATWNYHSHNSSNAKRIGEVNATCTKPGYTGDLVFECGVVFEYGVQTPAIGHAYSIVVTNPTCVAKGYTTHTCSRCGDNYTDSYTNALGHSFNAWKQTKAPTLDAEGEEARTCSRCGFKETRSVAKLLRPEIRIHNFTTNKSIDYRTTISFSADVSNYVEGAEVCWFIDGQNKGDMDTYTIKEAKKDFTVQAKYIQNGQVLAESEVETVKVNAGFFARLKAFFRALFGSLPKVVQEYLGVEIIDKMLL